MKEPGDISKSVIFNDDGVCCSSLSTCGVKNPTLTAQQQQQQQQQHTGSSCHKEKAFLACSDENYSESKNTFSIQGGWNGADEDADGFGDFCEAHAATEAKSASVGAPITTAVESSLSAPGEDLHEKEKEEIVPQRQSPLHAMVGSSSVQNVPTPCKSTADIRRPMEASSSAPNNGNYTDRVPISAHSAACAQSVRALGNSLHAPHPFFLQGASSLESSLSANAMDCCVGSDEGLRTEVASSLHVTSCTAHVTNGIGISAPIKGSECNNGILCAMNEKKDIVECTHANLLQRIQDATKMRDDTYSADRCVGEYTRDTEDKEKVQNCHVNNINNGAVSGISVTAQEFAITKVCAQETHSYLCTVSEETADGSMNASKVLAVHSEPIKVERTPTPHEESSYSPAMASNCGAVASPSAESIETSACELQNFMSSSVEPRPKEYVHIPHMLKSSLMPSSSKTIASGDDSARSPSCLAALQQEGTDGLPPCHMSHSVEALAATNGDEMDSGCGKEGDAKDWRTHLISNGEFNVTHTASEMSTTAVVDKKENNGGEFGDITDAPLGDSATSVKTNDKVRTSKEESNPQEQPIEEDHQMNTPSTRGPLVTRIVRFSDTPPTIILCPTAYEEEETPEDSRPNQSDNSKDNDDDKNNNNDDDDNDYNNNNNEEEEEGEEDWADFTDASFVTASTFARTNAPIKPMLPIALAPVEGTSDPSSLVYCDEPVPIYKVSPSIPVVDDDKTTFVFERDIDLEPIKDLLLVVGCVLDDADSSANVCRDSKDEYIEQNSPKMSTKHLPSTQNVSSSQPTKSFSTEHTLDSVMDALAFRQAKVSRNPNEGTSAMDGRTSIGASFIVGDSVSMSLAPYSVSANLHTPRQPFISADPIAAMQIAAQHATQRCEKLDVVLRRASEQQRNGPPVPVADLIARMRARIPQQGEEQNAAGMVAVDEAGGIAWRIHPTLPIPSIGGGVCPKPSLRLPH